MTDDQSPVMPGTDPSRSRKDVLLVALTVVGVGIGYLASIVAAITGTVIARLLIPGTTLAALCVAGRWLADVDPGDAVMCYGTGATVGAVICATLIRRNSPPEFFVAAPACQTWEWLRECCSFAVISFLMSRTLRISLIVVGTVAIRESEISHFAAAMETGCLILLLAKSTDKLFEPEMSAILYQRDWGAGLKLRSRRYALVGTGCGLFLLTMFLFGRAILGLYGPGYVAGYPALCLVSVGACTSTMFSLAPAYLRFAGQNRFVMSVIVAGAVLMAVLTMVMGIAWGATGAGGAFCVVLCLMAFTLRVAAARHTSRQTGMDADSF